MKKLVTALAWAAITATLLLAIQAAMVVALTSKAGTPFTTAVLFFLFGGVVIFFITFFIAAPLYIVFRRLGGTKKRHVYIGGSFLSMLPLAVVGLQNIKNANLFLPQTLLICLICGLGASFVFCRKIMGKGDLQTTENSIGRQSSPRP